MKGTILIAAQFYPPSDMVAARRPSGLAKYLERLGYRVIVVTSGAWGDARVAGEPASEVVRTGDLMTSRLNWRRDNLEAWTSGSADYSSAISWPAKVVVPDVGLVTWLPYLLPAVARAVRRRSVDCVITTSGPESVHLAGLAVRRSVAWIADLRDGWGFETLHDWPTAPQRRLDSWIERRAMRSADLATAVSDPLAEDLRERLGVEAHTVTNAFDPDEVPRRTGRDELLDPDRFSIVHTGRMASSQRSPGPFFDALRILAGHAPELADRIELVLAGPLTAGEREQIDRGGFGARVRSVGSLPRPRALALQREADALLLLTAGGRRGEATGKLYEYLGAARPILVLGDRTEAARIVGSTASGLAVPAEQSGEIAAALESLLINDAGRVESSRAARYSYPEVTARVADLVERARASAARRGVGR